MAVICAATGTLAAWAYAAQGLSLSHYDAKAHLVVARRILDSLTPGWAQIGAVWLPLPHLLNALPVQVDTFYRTGASAIALSVLAQSLGVAALAWVVASATGSLAAALAAAAILGANPNLLYLQATPMTEPLLLGLVLLGLSASWAWISRPAQGTTWRPGLLLAAACLTRYEAWPFSAALILLVGMVLALRGHPRAEAAHAALRLAIWPALAVLAFLVLSRLTVGEWLVTGGFFVPDERTLGHPHASATAVTWGTRQLTGTTPYVAAVAGLVSATVALARRRLPSETLLCASLLACAALPFYAFVSGHPFRIRYMVPLVPAVAVGTGLAVGTAPRRLRAPAAAILAAAALAGSPPFAVDAPMLREAQWDRPRSEQRRAVTQCLAPAFERGNDLVLASMGSLAHYMQELSHEGFAIRDFVHEGNGERWDVALRAPEDHVQWILFEEQAEGGDVLTRLRHASPAFTANFARVCEGGGVALYRRK